MEIFNSDFWSQRYVDGTTGWDAGEATTPIKEFVDQLEDKTAKILIPGCGNAHEAAYLHQQGFANVYVCDWAQEPLDNLKKRVPTFPSEHLLCANFFELEEKDFDYIIEQTFFCALPPAMRPQYAEKMRELLSENGKLVGLLFSFELTEKGPPFGGSVEEYQSHFSKHFGTINLEECKNSIKPRLGNELFIEIYGTASS
ncbi:MAG: methyltransferase domain-containing protein [Aureispira sp.]|nr:methyltransferase domain-containing protein [Aureispira sp.]